MVRSRIVGTGHYAPEFVLTNEALSKRIDTSDEWIFSRTGIRERRVAGEGENTSDLAAKAAKLALEMAGKTPADVDLIIVGTVTADMPMPACAMMLQAKLGCTAPAFDVSAACAGSIYGLSIADQFIRSGAKKCVLVVGADVLSRVVDWEDRTTCVLFGDAAGAMVMVPETREVGGIYSTHLHGDGSHADILKIPAGGSAAPLSAEVLAQRLQHVKMNGREVFKVAVRSLVSAVEEALSANGVAAEEVAHVISHQANLRIVESVLDKLSIPLERAILNIHRYGNTSSASVPVTLDEGVRSGRIQDGDLVVMMAIGAGMAWGSTLIRW
ncbi:MAG: ketoacyl-ACP synthase III [Deltaproteobacteria bacterium]|nr:ketoacyl-ACP synthase III [Deltaproteobacteria bacterium]